MEIDGVSKTFTSGRRRVKALDNFSARVRSGVVTGLIGADGAGKTTLMRIAAGLLVPDSGSVTVLGMDSATDYLNVQSSIGYMPQRFGLYEDLSVRENLDLYADLHDLPKAGRKARYDELMEMTGLAPFMKRLAGRLSGGMKQKLGLACSLMNVPRLLILDEPTVGVDPVSRRELWEIVYRQVREEKMSVLLSTAYLDEAERCEDVILVHRGRVLGQGAPRTFSSAIRGHSFMLTPGKAGKRKLQEELSATEGIIDAIISGSKVRLVTADEMDAGQVEQRFGSGESFRAESVPPRFEDAFIRLLREQPSESEEGVSGLKPASVETAPVSGSRDEEVIVVEDLVRRFGDFYAVKNISFSVKRGEIFGLLGANGAGKSTTFRMLCGLLPASGGKLMVADNNLRTAGPEARASVGYMAQKFSLYPALTVIQNLNFFSSAYGLEGSFRRERIKWALDSFQLEHVKDARSADLPLGYKQRLALAAALMHLPPILFLDEPTSGVDPLARREFWRHINALAESGVTVMVTTHFMEEAEYCDRIVIMAEGEILARGTPEELKGRFRTEDNPNPTMEDAFIALIEEHQRIGEERDRT